MWTIAGNRYWGRGEKRHSYRNCDYDASGWGLKKQYNTDVEYESKTETYWESFARASLCNSNHIFATEGKRPALSLDRGGFRPVLFVDHIHHISWGRGAIKNVKKNRSFFLLFNYNYYFKITLDLISYLQGKAASWNLVMGFGHSLPLTVMVLALLYCSTSCCENWNMWTS